MRKKYDKVFLGIILTLLFFGFFVLASASLGMAAREGKNSYDILLKQVVLGGGVGFILFLLTSRIYYKKWKSLALPFFVISFCLTLLVFVPHIGFKYGGAARWLSLGSFTFQPSELLKFAFVVYLSSWLSSRRNEVPSFKAGFVPFLIIVGFVGVSLILQPDIGTLGVICITGALLFFLAGGRFTQLGLLLILGFVLVSALVWSKPYLKSRINIFFNESYDLQGAGYQTNQAKIAMGSGGIWGKGFGQGISKFNYLPEPTGDSIFAVIGEEFGFIGTTFLILLFLFFCFKCFHIANRASNTFGRLLASGIAILITVQVFVNMYAIAGLIPLTGLPLIFISQGGSALALALAEVGIILNISKYSL
ncbi:putative lipid II flippase FtsW [Patescibacteria group bacterium]|nr:putative lipid II flippase FtsW [Patescibacteria group bacterium]